MSKQVSRRQMIKAGVLAGAGLLVAGCAPGKSRAPQVVAQEATPTQAPEVTVQESTPTQAPQVTVQESTPTQAPQVVVQELTPTRTAYLPYVAKEPTSTPTATATATATSTATSTATATATSTATVEVTPTTPVPGIGPRVVHVHDVGATSRNGEADYWNYVNQAVVYDMVDRGVMALTGASTVAGAWQALLPSYQVGQGIAIKVNLNNSTDCGDVNGMIDAIIQPVNAVVRGLVQIGVAESDIWVYDAIRQVPDRLIRDNQYSNVQFFDRGCRNKATWTSSDPDAFVAFSLPSGVPAPPAIRISDVLINATYLINMPILKHHSPSSTGVSLSFKNHFGTINKPGDLHNYVCFNGSHYRSDHNALVDLYRNSHIVDKTILILGDGLFAAKNYGAGPSRWATFGGQVPNSLFFATDPVAADCVMCDLLDAEQAVPAETDNYLRLASSAGLGVFERGDPWGSGYTLIDYRVI